MPPSSHDSLEAQLKRHVTGDVDASEATLLEHSLDASLFQVKPKVVVYPKNSKDVQAVVKFVNENRSHDASLSITARSAGTDMAGGPLNTSIILDFTRYMNHIISVNPDVAVVEPGCFYRDFDKETQKINRMLPSYTASREICAVGGMVANNSGGEKTIKFGKTEQYISYLKVVFTDGNEYLVKPLTKAELDAKCAKQDFEATIYKKISDIINANKAEIMAAKPNVSKNSAGYYLWNVWDEATQTFDLCKLIVGSQGTLGFVTEIGFKLVPVHPFSNVLAIFMPNLEQLPQIVNAVMPFKPDSFESYDDYSLLLAMRFFFDFFVQLGFWGAIKLGLQFIPDAWLIVTGGIPKMTLIVEFSGDSKEEIRTKLLEVQKHIEPFHFKSRVASSPEEAEKYWKVRRESFNMLRKHVHGKRTAPFIDDIIVRPEHLPTFIPEINAILKAYKLDYSIAGHAGDGNFHIIPLIDFGSVNSADQILEIAHKVYDLVDSYKGSITAEHNDGIMRTPFLPHMYGEKIIALFKQTKDAFDPQNIFNPGKKVGGTFDDIKAKLIRKNN